MEEIRLKGKSVRVSSLRIDNNVVIITGKLIRTASIRDECYEDVQNPISLIKELRNCNLEADIFTFLQQLPEIRPKYDYFMEWDNVAAIPITSFADWWTTQITTKTRNMVRKAKKIGVNVKVVDFNDQLVQGILNIYNETPIRQGKPFWHYGKDFETLKEMHATFLDRAVFLGAYYKDELIGFHKLVYSKNVIRTMHIISKVRHRDKAPTNALIAKAVEIASDKGIPYLVYDQFDYGKTGNRSLVDFKRHNGFRKILLPRYFIPLTTKGRIIIKLKLHHGIVGLLPEKLIRSVIELRTKWYVRKYGNDKIV